MKKNRRSVQEIEFNEMRKLDHCPCCGIKIKPCPHCGKPGMIYGCNMVGCSDDLGCGANIDFGHWVGYDDNGIPAEHYVITQWNTRHKPHLFNLIKDFITYLNWRIHK